MPHGQVFIQLGDLWGDPTEGAVWDTTFLSGVRNHRLNAPIVIVVPSESRAVRVQSGIGGSSDVSIVTLASLRADHLVSADEVVIACTGARKDLLRDINRRVRTAGLVRAGRAWGEAGDTYRYIRPRSLRDRIDATLAEARVQIGAGVVHVRDSWLRPSRLTAGIVRTRMTFGSAPGRAGSLDSRFGDPLPHVGTIDVRDLLPEPFGIDQPAWSIAFDRDDAPDDAARSCLERYGVWPISFSFPGEPLPLLDTPGTLIAPIVPGVPYTFVDANRYYESYRDAYLGLTHRKAGWDCFRHTEILAAGAIPLMPDAGEVPRWSMVHYPTRTLARVADVVRVTGGPPTQQVREEFRSWFRRYLTSANMARYLLSSLGLHDDARVLFVDERLSTMVDYQSVLTLIGLKQVLGQRCEVLTAVGYVYDDFAGDPARLYGRGFGYARVLPSNLRTPRERGEDSGEPPWTDFDAVVIGSIARNSRVANEVLRQVPPARVTFIHGEDTPPSAADVALWLDRASHVFVRAIHSGTQGGA